jgi:phage tail sheath gpL-like
VAASATITLASCATDTVTIGGITFTGSATPSGDVQFETDGDDTADAAALAAKINAHPTLSAVVGASSNLGVVTVTAKVKGVVGNFITLSETGSTITVSGSALAGGTGGPSGSATTYSFGL